MAVAKVSPRIGHAILAGSRRLLRGLQVEARVQLQKTQIGADAAQLKRGALEVRRQGSKARRPQVGRRRAILAPIWEVLRLTEAI